LKILCGGILRVGRNQSRLRTSSYRLARGSGVWLNKGILGRRRPGSSGCLVLDVRLPGQSGLDFHDGLSEANVHLLVIFISAHSDVPMSVRAMKAGAAEFLTKPVQHQELLETFRRTIERGRTRRADERLFRSSGRF
jgi:FixJ family two-component response regulator